MAGTPGPSSAGSVGGGSRGRDHSKTTPSNKVNSPLANRVNGGMTTGKMTPSKGRLDGQDVKWGYETPTNKILSNIPVTVTNRSSERRRRVKTDGSDPEASEKPNFGPAFVVAPASAKVKSPNFGPAPPRTRDRSDSTSSTRSEINPGSRKMNKAPSFISERATTPVPPPTTSGNFFHAKDRPDNRAPSVEPGEKFFFAASKAKPVSSLAPANVITGRRLSNGSQYSTFTTAKDPVQPKINTNLNSTFRAASPTPPIRSPLSPTKASFIHMLASSTPPSPTNPILKHASPTSPLRKVLTPSPPREAPSSSSSTETSTSVSTRTSGELSVLKSINSTPATSETSEDEQPTKTLLPTPTTSIEDSARINRKIADLEISNSSLLAVNKGLERLTREQALEIRSLRKQLRQSHRISVAPLSVTESGDFSEEDEEDEELDDSFEKGEIDLDIRLSLEKCIFLSEQMLAEGRKGLEYRVRTSELPSGRVLSGEWRDDSSR